MGLYDNTKRIQGLSETELGFIDGVTAGTVKANKAIVVDANKDISTVRNITVTNLDAGASGTAGTVDVFPATASRGKSSFACANQTGDTVVTHNTNAMGQTTQINTPDPGVAAATQVLSTAHVTLAEADVLDGATKGTQVASKVVVADTNVNTGVSKVTELHIGATGAETQVTATPAQLNNIVVSSETLTISGAVTAGKSDIFLDHTSATIAATIADASLHSGIRFIIKATTEPGGGQDHTCTITTGTWDGTNKVATFTDINDSLVVYFDAAGDGDIALNTGSVALS